VYGCMCVCVYVWMCVCVYVCMCVCVYVCMCVSVYVCMCVCVCVHVMTITMIIIMTMMMMMMMMMLMLMMKGADFRTTITRARFEEMNADLFYRCLQLTEKVLNDAKVAKGNIAEVFLVGGCSRIPKLQALVSEHFDDRLTPTGRMNAVEGVAGGAAIQAAILGDQVDIPEKLRGLLWLSMTARSLGFETKGCVMTSVIRRHTTINTKRSVTVSTVGDNQTSIRFRIFEGEHRVIETSSNSGV
jgi:heat shock protein 1/8